MEFYPFPALLMANYGSTHVYGRAVVRPPNSVDFTSDFIPLLPLSAEATVEWVLGTKSITTFSGSVYLSSPQLLRLVDVSAQQLEDIAKLFMVNTRLPASTTKVETSRFKQKPPHVAVEILYLTNDVIKLRTTDDVAVGTLLLLYAQVEFLSLCEQPIKVVNKIVLQKDETLLICSVEKSDDENFIAISTYAARLLASENSNP